MASTLSEVSHKSQKATRYCRRQRVSRAWSAGWWGRDGRRGGKSRGGHAMKSLGLRLHP